MSRLTDVEYGLLFGDADKRLRALRTGTVQTCERHPDDLWPHDGCAGPGMDVTGSLELLGDALDLIASLAPGEAPLREWLMARPDLDATRRMPAGWTLDGGQF